MTAWSCGLGQNTETGMYERSCSCHSKGGEERQAMFFDGSLYEPILTTQVPPAKRSRASQNSASCWDTSMQNRSPWRAFWLQTLACLGEKLLLSSQIENLTGEVRVRNQTEI